MFSTVEYATGCQTEVQSQTNGGKITWNLHHVSLILDSRSNGFAQARVWSDCIFVNRKWCLQIWQLLCSLVFSRLRPLRLFTVMFSMHNWRFFSLKFDIYLSMHIDFYNCFNQTFFGNLMLLFFLSVNEKQFLNFKPWLGITNLE